MEPRQLRAALASVSGLAIFLVVGFFICQLWARPTVIQHDNLKYIQLLRTACSSQREDQLEGVARAVAQRREVGDMNESEWKEFEKIFAIARQGDWRTADEQAYRLELGQLGRNRP